MLQDHCGNVSLPLPTACPHQKPNTSFSITDLLDEQADPDKEGHLQSTEKLNLNKANYLENTMEMNPPTPREGSKKKRANKRATPIVDSQVRRSDRLKQGTNGFKTQGCSNWKCTTCNPPTLSSKVIRNLGTQFCSLEQEELAEEELLKRQGPKNPVSKKKTKTGKENAEENKEEDSDRKEE
jgi:hypothetical protein